MSRAIPLFGVPEPCNHGCCPGGMPDVLTRRERRWIRRAAERLARRRRRRAARRAAARRATHIST